MKATLLLFALTISATAADWNQWRGPERNGTTDAGLPANLGGLKKIWSVDLAEGYSSPVVRDGIVYTVETKDKEREIARAFDLETGEQLWEVDWIGSMKVPFFAAKNGSWVRSTPAVTGDGVYIGGIRDVLVKLDPKTGKEIWRVDFMERESTQLPAFGFVCSPLPDGDAVYVQGGCAVTKLDAETGKTIWRAMENRQAMFGSAFSSPIIATIHGKRQLVAQTRSELGGIDLESGEVLWSTPVKAFRGMNILTPEVFENRIFTATYGGGSMLFEISKTGEDFAVERVWSDETIEGYMSTPVRVGNHIYLQGRSQHFYCLNLEDGNVEWKSDEKFGQYWSMITDGESILVLDQKGELLLIKASPANLEIVDRKKVSDQETWAHICLNENLILIRGLKQLCAFELPGS